MDALAADDWAGDFRLVPLCPRLRSCDRFWQVVAECEERARGEILDDHWEGWDDTTDDDWWDEEDDLDDDGDRLGCWEGERFTLGLCPDDLCHGANRCMAKPRPWDT